MTETVPQTHALERKGIRWLVPGLGHKVGDRFVYPAEAGPICSWLQDSMSGFLRTLEYGGTLPWRYAGTKYEKEIDPDGVTTEFVRCPDPTTKVVAKITRTRVG